MAEKKGREEGKKEGQREKTEEMVRNLLAKKMDIEFIAEVTGLAAERIKEIALMK